MVIVKPPAHHAIRTRQGLGVVALLLPDMRGDVRADIVVDAGRLWGQCLFEIDHRRNRLEIDDDIGERVLGQVAALGDDDGKRLADITNLVARQGTLRALMEGDAVDRRRRHHQGAGLPEIAEVAGGVDGDDAAPGARGRSIDVANVRVRHLAAQQRGVQQAGQFDVVDEERLPGQQPAILVALDRGAEISGRHAGALPIFVAARSTASTMCW